MKHSFRPAPPTGLLCGECGKGKTHANHADMGIGEEMEAPRTDQIYDYQPAPPPADFGQMPPPVGGKYLQIEDDNGVLRIIIQIPEPYDREDVLMMLCTFLSEVKAQSKDKEDGK